MNSCCAVPTVPRNSSYSTSGSGLASECLIEKPMNEEANALPEEKDQSHGAVGAESQKAITSRLMPACCAHGSSRQAKRQIQGAPCGSPARKSIRW